MSDQLSSILQRILDAEMEEFQEKSFRKQAIHPQV